MDIPDYIEARIRQRPPAGIRVVPGSTPVIAFGDARNAKVATLGWNPSRLEFLDRNGKELVEGNRRLETLASIEESDLVTAPDNAVQRIFHACNDYFKRNPYNWFDKFEKIFEHVGASYYDGTACHLDFVQWATDPVWRGLSRSDQIKLIGADLAFLRRQLSQEGIRLLLLNGSGIVKGYEEKLGAELEEAPVLGGGRLKLFTGRDTRGLNVMGWNINLQSGYGVSNKEIEMIGAEVGRLYRD
jgi:hypothetical protein